MSYTEVKDSGKRQQFETGAVRDTSEGKGRYDLLPAYALKRVAQHFENGARKYADENWRKGMPLRKYLDSAIRHAFNFLEGQRDEDHAAAAAWNILALIETEEMIRRGILPASLNNLPNWLAPDEEQQDEREALLDPEQEYNGDTRTVVVSDEIGPIPPEAVAAMATPAGQKFFGVCHVPALASKYDGKWVPPDGWYGEAGGYVEIDGQWATRWLSTGVAASIYKADKITRSIIDEGGWVPYTGPEVVTPLERFDASCEKDSDQCGCGLETGPWFGNYAMIQCLENQHK